MSEAVTEVRDLTIELSDGSAVVENVNFSIARGEILGLVGESGSGKTTVATALLGYYRAGANVRSGSVRVREHEITGMTPAALQDIRAKVVAYVPQDPAGSLNPVLRIGRQLDELLDVHENVDRQERRRRIEAALTDVRLPSDDEFLARYPHQISGGQAQRLCLAMAFLLEPSLVVLDEPTTGLDVTSQSYVLHTIRNLCKRKGAAALYVSHDLAVVASLVDRVMVMYSGRVLEQGALNEVLHDPAHPYSRRLVAASPDLENPRRLLAISGHAPSPRDRPQGCRFGPRCDLANDLCRATDPIDVELTRDHIAACHRIHESSGQSLLGAEIVMEIPTTEPVLRVSDLSVAYGDRTIVKGVSFEVRAGECLALVGESGSGKTTIARTLIGLKEPKGGTITLNGQSLAAHPRARTEEQLRTLQFIFQNPHASLNPRKQVGDILGKPIRYFHGSHKDEVRERAAKALARVALPPRVLDLYSRDLSGGERQRVAIARALVCEPQVLICDEITSALDVSVQAAVVELLDELRREQGLSLLFVTHNLALVRTIADSVAVFNQGRIVEYGATAEVLMNPSHEYTTELLSNTPSFGDVQREAPAVPLASVSAPGAH